MLNPSSRGSLHGASEIGTHGMGGVGKATALKRMWSVESVKGRFEDGVCFTEFGENATIQVDRGEICRCVRNFVGFETAKDVRRAQNLGDVLKQAAES